MARILLLALLVWIPVERCSGAALPETFEIDDSNSAENVEMDLMLMNDAEQSADASQDQLQERQFGLGFGGLGGFGLGYGGYGGLGLGYGGFGGGVCTRACFGIGCRVICRNRLFFDEDPEGSQDTELVQDPSLMEGSDEFQDPIFIDDSLLTNPVPENIKGLPLPPKEEKKEKDHKKCAEKHVKDNIDLTRVPPTLSTTDRRRFEMMAGTDSSKWNTDARVQELTKAGYKVVVVPHHIFKRLRPNDIVLRRTVKNTMNPEDKDSSAIRKELLRRFMESSKTSSENVDPSLFMKHTSETNRINRIPTDSKRVDIPWSLMGSNRRRETIEGDNRLPLTSIGATTNVENASHLEGGKFIRVPEESLMKKKHHRRPVIIIMDENQDPQVPQ